MRIYRCVRAIGDLTIQFNLVRSFDLAHYESRECVSYWRIAVHDNYSLVAQRHFSPLISLFFSYYRRVHFFILFAFVTTVRWMITAQRTRTLRNWHKWMNQKKKWKPNRMLYTRCLLARIWRCCSRVKLNVARTLRVTHMRAHTWWAGRLEFTWTSWGTAESNSFRSDENRWFLHFFRVSVCAQLIVIYVDQIFAARHFDGKSEWNTFHRTRSDLWIAVLGTDLTVDRSLSRQRTQKSWSISWRFI